MGKDEFWANLEKLGVERVRENDDLGLYAGRKKTWVDAWLNKKERQKQNQTPWHKTWWWPLLSTFILAVLLAVVLYRLGLN